MGEDQPCRGVQGNIYRVESNVFRILRKLLTQRHIDWRSLPANYWRRPKEPSNMEAMNTSRKPIPTL
jgi:hypothetical protein